MKELILIKPKPKFFSKFFGVILIIIGSIFFITGLLAILTIIGIFYTMAAWFITYALIHTGLGLICGKVKIECSHCKKKLSVIAFQSSIKCRCKNLILIKFK